MAVVDQFTFFGLEIQLHAVRSAVEAHPRTQVNLFGSDWRLLGGGAVVEPHAGAGNMLTAMYPVSEQEWDVGAKDHIESSPAQVTAWCTAARLNDGPIQPDAYQIVEATSGTLVNYPRIEVALPAEFVLVGGGARVNWEETGGNGNLLTVSRPGMGESWVAAAKDHLVPSPATITAYAIGLHRTFLEQLGLTVVKLRANTIDPNPAPRISCGIDERAALLVSGGAEMQWNGAGSLLTASGFSPTPGGLRPWSWLAQGKDHIASDPSRITVWGLALVKY